MAYVSNRPKSEAFSLSLKIEYPMADMLTKKLKNDNLSANQFCKAPRLTLILLLISTLEV